MHQMTFQRHVFVLIRLTVEATSAPQSPSEQVVANYKEGRNISAFSTQGIALFLGVGDTGQLGLGPDITERSRPAHPTPESLSALQITKEKSQSYFTQICCGGMHSVCLTVCGNVATCGCNDEGALGRITQTESGTTDNDSRSGLHPVVDECHLGLVSFPVKVKVVMVSAGDSHTAALDSNGQVWLWGTFRGSSGPIGLTQPGEISETPRPLLAYPLNGSAESSDTIPATDSKSGRLINSALLTPGASVIKIASGQDHLVCLTDDGRLYTMGCGEQGQLGRVAERFAKDGGRSGISSLLQPTECRVRGAVRFSNVWAGGFGTFALCQSTGAVYACGLNNYGQLGLRDTTSHEISVDSNSLEETMETEVCINENAARLVTDRHEADRSEAQLVARQGPIIQFMLTRAFGFDPGREWLPCRSIRIWFLNRNYQQEMKRDLLTISLHFCMQLVFLLGHVYVVGRPDYGRLGLGRGSNVSKISVNKPTRVLGALKECVCSWVGCGEACSFAVDTNGESNYPDLNHRILMIDAGGQHTVMLACSTVQSNEVNADTDVVMRNVNEVSNGTPESSVVIDANTTLTSDSNVCSNNTVEKQIDNTLSSEPTKISDTTADTSMEPILIAPMGPGAPQSKRNRRSSRSSVAGSTGTTLLTPVGFSCDSTTGSTAGATINSSVHSSAVSDTCSVGSCASTSSTSSQLNSAKSTDGGGSSRCSSFDNYSVQSSLLLLPSAEEKTCKDK
ncbi:unnamed protein product [Trichobilharzia regenti]|nr:unnamed protein product [Trichobilharzia regenti]